MNQELIQSLSVITEEEQKILAGSADIDGTLYMDREDMVIDSDKLLEAGQLITIRPYPFCAFSGAHPQLCGGNLHVQGGDHPCGGRQGAEA